MKLFLQILTLIMTCNFVVACTKNSNGDDTRQKHVKIEDVGGDQTDIFAIPFDTSEFDEEQEMQNLRSIGERNEEKAQKKK